MGGIPVKVKVDVSGEIRVKLVPPSVLLVRTAAGQPQPRGSEGGPVGVAIAIRDDEQVDITITQILDDEGQVIQPDGPPTFTSDNPAAAIATADPSERDRHDLSRRRAGAWHGERDVGAYRQRQSYLRTFTRSQ